RCRLLVGGGNAHYLTFKLDSDWLFADGKAHVSAKLQLGLAGHELALKLPEMDVIPDTYHGQDLVQVNVSVLARHFYICGRPSAASASRPRCRPRRCRAAPSGRRTSARRRARAPSGRGSTGTRSRPSRNGRAPIRSRSAAARSPRAAPGAGSRDPTT